MSEHFSRYSFQKLNMRMKCFRCSDRSAGINSIFSTISSILCYISRWYVKDNYFLTYYLKKNCQLWDSPDSSLFMYLIYLHFCLFIYLLIYLFIYLSFYLQQTNLHNYKVRLNTKIEKKLIILKPKFN